MHVSENDPDGQARLADFVEALKELGWAEGHNLRLEVRWGPNDPNRYPRQAAELVAINTQHRGRGDFNHKVEDILRSLREAGLS